MTKIIALYLLILAVICSVIYFFTSSRRQRLFSVSRLEELISTPSRWRPRYASPCEAVIAGDPSAGDNWVKLNFHCSDADRVSTFVLPAVSPLTWGTLITEYARVIGFPSSAVISSVNWKCYINTKTPTLMGWDLVPRPRQSLDCYAQNN
jgi:hypothetical protein